MKNKKKFIHQNFGGYARIFLLGLLSLSVMLNIKLVLFNFLSLFYTACGDGLERIQQ